MNQNQNHDDALETRIAAWLREEARGDLPDWVLISTFEQTRMEPQRRGIHGWIATLQRRSWKEPAPSSQRRLTMFSALRATVAAVLIAVIGAGLAVNLFEEPEVSPGGAPAAESPASPEPSGSPAPSSTAGGAPVSLWTSQGDPHDQLRTPGQIALAPDGNLWVHDGTAGRFQILGPDGSFIEAWGSPGSGDGEFDFIRPDGLTYGDIDFAPDGSFYVADTDNHRIQHFDADRAFVSAWGSEGEGPGLFLDPIGVAIGPDGNVYVIDDQRDDVQVFDRDGAYLFTFGGHGSAEGELSDTGFIDVASDGTVYVADYGNNRVEAFGADGVFRATWGGPGRKPGTFNNPQGIAVGPGGLVYVADYRNQRVEAFDARGELVAEWSSAGAGGDSLRGPIGLAVDGAGDVYVSEYFGDRVQRFAALSAQSSPAPEATVTTLLEVTLDGKAIPEELAGILFFRKIYATDHEIVYGAGFIPPNTFARYVESGQLGIRPHSPTRIVRAGSSWADAEVVAAEDEALVGAGDAFVMQDIPWDEYGSQALGEMWTPADDARVVGFAIRETSRCCSMSHMGMTSPWHPTLTGPRIEALRGRPFSVRIERWDVPPGSLLPAFTDPEMSLAVVDSGVMTTRITPQDEGDSSAKTVELRARPGQTVIALPADANRTIVAQNSSDEPVVVYELTVRPADEEASSALHIAAVDAGRMARSRSGHSATALPDGGVLVSSGGWAEEELFDPESGAFEPAGTMARIRGATATLLDDGRVLLAGGGDRDAETWDPVTRTVEPTGTLVEERRLHTSTLLADGRVLVAGGGTDTAEIYDPVSGSFESTGRMLASREDHTATLLDDGRVLVAGGGSPPAELYDPVSGTFESLGSAASLREHATATRLLDGRVLLVGDSGPAEIYDPATETFEASGVLNVPRYHHAATLLPDGRVLISGGMDLRHHEPSASIEVYDPATGLFSQAGSLLRARWNHTATSLPDGRVLITGGTSSGSASTTASAEIIEIAPSA